MKQKIEKLIIDSNFNSINREELIEQAKAKRIKNYKRIPKEGLVKHLWMSADPCIVDKTNLKRIKTCNKKKNKEVEPQSLKEEEIVVQKNIECSFEDRFIKFDEHGSTCSLCGNVCDLFKCSVKYMFCEKKKTCIILHV